MKVAKLIKTDTYYTTDEIEKHLQNVEYVILAQPAPSVFEDAPIHFSIFLNTREELPLHAKEAVFDKFLNDYGIFNPQQVLNRLMNVGFSMGEHDTPYPILLVEQKDINSIAHVKMHVMDFLADSNNFDEAKIEKLSGWSYKYCD